MSHWGSQPYKQKNSSFVSFYNLSNFSAWHKGGDLKKKIGKVGHRGEWSGVEWKGGGGGRQKMSICEWHADMLFEWPQRKLLGVEVSNAVPHLGETFFY